MNISIHPKYQKFIDDQVKAGRFTSSGEALEAGIARLMDEADVDVLDEQDIADIELSLRQIERGEVVDAKALHAELLARISKK